MVDDVVVVVIVATSTKSAIHKFVIEAIEPAGEVNEEARRRRRSCSGPSKVTCKDRWPRQTD